MAGRAKKFLMSQAKKINLNFSLLSSTTSSFISPYIFVQTPVSNNKMPGLMMNAYQHSPNSDDPVHAVLPIPEPKIWRSAPQDQGSRPVRTLLFYNCKLRREGSCHSGRFLRSRKLENEFKGQSYTCSSITQESTI